MPELPEVEHLRRTLAPAIVGRRVTRVRLVRRDVVVRPGDPPGGFSRTGSRPASRRVPGRELLSGQRLAEIIRHGKQLAIVADTGRVLCVHLGMTGGLLHLPARTRSTDPQHVHAVWNLDGGSRLLFRDPRRFGGLWTLASLDALRTGRWASLGPDALTVTPRALRERLARTTRAIKAALLDQGVVAGVGNIYADESLFLARVNPRRPADALTSEECAGLCRALKRTLRDAIDAGGSTLRDYADARGLRGAYQLRHDVYARAGLPCKRCHSALVGATIAQRSTVWCPRCQPMGSPPSLHTVEGVADGRASLSREEEESNSSSPFVSPV